MRKLVLFLTIFFSACASNQKYSQERLKDQGKNVWMVRALEVPCKKNFKECRDNVKKEIGGRSRKICKKQIFRVVKCDYEESGSATIAASCTVHCGERPKPKDAIASPSSSSHDDSGDGHDGKPKKEDEAKPFDWTDQ